MMKMIHRTRWLLYAFAIHMFFIYRSIPSGMDCPMTDPVKRDLHVFLSPMSAAPKLKLPTPIIVVGFPKSGTTSTHAFFHCAGALTQHFCCCGDPSDHPPCPTMAKCILQNMANHRPMFENCGEYQVYAQIDGERPGRKRGPGRRFVLLNNGTSVETKMAFRHFLPQHFHLEDIHRDYPNATFVLPLRPPEDWARSAMNWFQMRLRFTNEYIAYDNITRPTKSESYDFLTNVYKEHTNFVRDFVNKHPSHILVEYDITDENTGDLLGNAFGLPSSCWGHHNQIGNRSKGFRKNTEPSAEVSSLNWKSADERG